MSTHPLIQISQFVQSHTGVAVIFDLDSTLFCVSPRTQAILRKLGSEEQFQARFSEASEVLRHIEVLPSDWGIRTVLERAKVPGNLTMFMQIRDYWREHFFANHFLEHDQIYPSANSYVRHLHELGADILYLTGRNEAKMLEGTRKALQHWSFPYFADSKLLMKPHEVLSDEGFKAEVLEKLAQSYEHIVFFENEPVIIQQVRQRIPQIQIVFVDSVHSGRADAPNDLLTINSEFSAGLPRSKK